MEFKLKDEEVILAIEAAEKNTSGEIRVHIEETCEKDVMDRAADLFAELNMHKTELRNGVLIYIAYKSHLFAIIGDAGINSKVGQDFWGDIKAQILTDFKKGDYTFGLVRAVTAVGEKLQTYYPFQRGDSNELDNTISYGK